MTTWGRSRMLKDNIQHATFEELVVLVSIALAFEREPDSPDQPWYGQFACRTLHEYIKG